MTQSFFVLCFLLGAVTVLLGEPYIKAVRWIEVSKSNCIHQRVNTHYYYDDNIDILFQCKDKNNETRKKKQKESKKKETTA